MSIRRSARKQSFTVVDNAVFNSGLSYRAIGLLTYLLSKPDHWEVSVAHLVNVSKDSAAPSGRDAIYSTIRELESKGFITKGPKRDESGKMDGMEYVVHDVPLTPEPHTDEPDAANPTQVNTEVIVNTEVSKTPSSSDDDAAAIDAAFEAFWKAGMRKVGKQKAKTIFKRKLKESKQQPHEFATMLINDIKARIELQQMGFDKLHPERYLSNQRWEDEYADDRQQQKPGRQQMDWDSDFINDPNRLEL